MTLTQTPAPLMADLIACLDPTSPSEFELVVETANFHQTEMPVTRAPRGVSPLAATSRVEFPKIHSTFLDFRLTAELGTGAFGKVYLAEQTNLANRIVALKITTRANQEPEQLAKLHHTNIMPIYSVHNVEPFQAVCMPYLGSQTLATVITEYHGTRVFPYARPTASTKAVGRYATTMQSKSSDNPAAISAHGNTVEHSKPSGAIAHVDWVIEVILALAQGLKHAHDRNILHLDIKPANVLISDDGVPYLLDFNLAYDRTTLTRPKTGGTIPYMSPEQLEAFRDGKKDYNLDERTDLFSLGVIFYELLTGEHPFPRYPGRPNLTQMTLDRMLGAPRVSQLHPSISPAVDSIVATLLNPHLDQRYPNAAALVEDLTRHMQHRPLVFAQNPSFVEDLMKWKRRNPRAGMFAGIAAMTMAVAGLSYGVLHEFQGRAYATALVEKNNTLEKIPQLELDLLLLENDKTRAQSQQATAKLLADFGFQPGKPWEKPQRFAYLSVADQQSLLQDLGALTRILSVSEMIPFRGNTSTAAQDAARRALAWNHLAAECYEPAKVPSRLYESRRNLEGILKLPLTAIPEGMTRENTSTELFLEGAEAFLSGRFRDAIQHLDKATLLQPGHGVAQFLLAQSHHELKNFAPALERYHLAKALIPQSGRPSLNRGMILLQLKQLANAEKELNDSIERESTLLDARRWRGKLYADQHKHADAILDLTFCIEHDFCSLQSYTLRAEMYDKMGNTAAKQTDWELAAKYIPKTTHDFSVRAKSREATDPTGAIEDYARAVDLNPNFYASWHNQVRIYADVLDQNVKALEIQNRIVKLFPDHAAVYSVRSVIHARLGNRDQALLDIDEACSRSDSPATHLMAANAYSQLSKKHPEDTRYALDHFKLALAAGYTKFDELATDRDLEAVHSHPEFHGLLEAAKQLRK
jgi:eukaryotic-like serine/threonine-protein kinase